MMNKLNQHTCEASVGWHSEPCGILTTRKYGPWNRYMCSKHLNQLLQGDERNDPRR